MDAVITASMAVMTAIASILQSSDGMLCMYGGCCMACQAGLAVLLIPRLYSCTVGQGGATSLSQFRHQLLNTSHGDLLLVVLQVRLTCRVLCRTESQRLTKTTQGSMTTN